MRTFVRSARTGRWSEVASCPIDGASDPKRMNGPRTRRVDPRTGTDDLRSVWPDGGTIFHCWIATKGTATIEHWDVAAAHMSLEARLAVDDASRLDDRGRALYLLHAGGTTTRTGRTTWARSRRPATTRGWACRAPSASRTTGRPSTSPP